MALVEARTSLLATLRTASGDRAALAAKGAHRWLRLHEPTVEEASAYRRNGGSVMAQAALKSAESLMRLRGKLMPRGTLETSRADFQEKVKARLCGSVSLKGERQSKEFDEIASNFSRLVAVYYVDGKGMQPDRIGESLEMILPRLASHLLAELELCMEAKFAKPAKIVCKFSVFEISAKLQALRNHADKVVKANVKTIINAAVHCGNLGLVDGLAGGADAKLRMLKRHRDAIVRKNARTIVHTALLRGNLELADRLAAGADAKLRMLKRHRDAIVRKNARTIASTGLRSGNLALVDRLAAGANEKLETLRKHADAVVRKYARTIINAALNKGNLGVADRLADGANAKLEMLRGHADAVVRKNARTIVCTALDKGNLKLADRLAKGAANVFDEIKMRLGKRPGAKKILSEMLAAGTLDVDARLKKAA